MLFFISSLFSYFLLLFSSILFVSVSFLALFLVSTHRMKMHFMYPNIINTQFVAYKHKNSIHINLSSILPWIFVWMLHFFPLPVFHLLALYLACPIAFVSSCVVLWCAVLCCVDLTVKLINNAFEAIFLPPALFSATSFIHSLLRRLNHIVYNARFFSFLSNLCMCV